MQLRVTRGDADLLARYCMSYKTDQRAQKCRALLAQVAEAGLYLRLTGRAHPFYGDGSVASLVLRLSLPQMSAHLSRDAIAAYSVALDEISKQPALSFASIHK